MSASIDNEQFRNLLFSWPEKAILFLYEHYYDHLIRIADMHTHDRRTSEDVLQEVFADVWKKHRTLGQQRDQSIQSYLIKAVAYHAISLYKKRARTAEREKEYFFGAISDPVDHPAEEGIIFEENRTFIRLILGTFPLRERQCLLMQTEEELPVKEIAKRLGISRKAVERSLTSARKRLKKFRPGLL